MTIDVIGSLEELKALTPEWSNLYRCCPRATPFQSPQWLVPWTRYLFGGGHIWALAIRDHGEMIGFAPLFCWGIQERRVSFLGAGVSDYGDLLFAPGREPECVSAVWDFLRAGQHSWDVLDLQELRSGSAMLAGSRSEVCSVCPVLDLSSYPAAMDHKHRTDVRRAHNKLRRHSALRFEMANETSSGPAMEEFFRLYEARWGAMEGVLRQFHLEVAAAFLATGDLRLCLLELDSGPAASIYAFTAGPAVYCYLSGFDPAMASLSPGAVLLGWLIDHAIAEGIEQVNFLRKPEAYKYLWGARDTLNYKIVNYGIV